MKILVVDDDKRVLRFFVDVLTDSGYNVSLARNAEEALSLISKEAFDLVITDTEMLPGMSGVHLVNDTRRILPGQKFVGMSGDFNNRARFSAISVPFL